VALSAGSYLTFQNLQVNACGFANSSSVAISNLTIQNCTFKQNYAGIYLQTTNSANAGPVSILNCNFDYCRQPIYLVENNNYLWTATITGNTITHACQPGYNGATQNWPGGDREAIALQNLQNSKVNQNYISGGSADIATVGGDCICHWIATGAPATGNVFDSNQFINYSGCGLIHGAGDTGTANCRITRNIAVNCGTAGGASAPYGAFRLNGAETSSTPSIVANNVAYNCDIGYYLNGSSLDYYNLMNNIASGCTVPIRANVGVGHCVLSGNVYNGSGFNYNGTTETWSWWVSHYGETNSVNADPQWLNPGTDWHLRWSSPAIGIGTYVPGLTTDYYGVPIPPTGVSAGVSQFQPRPVGF